jgi:DNA repair protein RecN (Recombination protein N)
MLRELSVQNLALIEDVRVELQEGFCAWTGETGAGKSLLLGGLGLLLGERGSAELIRAGAEELRIAGQFEITRPEQRSAVKAILDEPLLDENLIISRRLSRSGRSSAYVNDRPVAVATLKRLGESLVDLHSQRESYSLLQPTYQLRLLDAFGNLNDLRSLYVKRADEVREIRRRRNELVSQRQQRQRDLALVRFEREELDAAALVAGEAAELDRERDRLANAQSLKTAASDAASRLHDEEGSIIEQLSKILKESQHWANIEPRFGEIVLRLEAAIPDLTDLASTSRDLADSFEPDPERLDQIEHRLQLIHRLEKKYGQSMEGLIAYHSTLEDREAELARQEDDLASIEGELSSAFESLRKVAQDLSKQRARVAKKLAIEAQKHLAALGMPDAKLDASLEVTPLGQDPSTAELPAFGIDHLELQLAANRGEPHLPLRKVASGGELSRIVLALKTVLAAHDSVGTLIFDEIDANVGGRLGDVLGEMLAKLAQTHQVICVSHLPQVASYARYHWTIRKQTKGKRTTTSIQQLTNEADRLEELAAMLRGEARGETTRQEVLAMLNRGKKKW